MCFCILKAPLHVGTMLFQHGASTLVLFNYFIIFGVCFIFMCQNCVLAQDLMCCSHATGSCRSVCEKISLVQLAADGKLKNQTVANLRKYCSFQLYSFWECLNATFKDMSRGESWSGRLCCPLPQSESCRRACITASSSFDLTQGCRRSDEIEFFNCIDRQHEGEQCCSNTKNEHCRNACLDIFKTKLTPTKVQRQNVKDLCETISPKVFNCVKDFIKVTPGTDLHLHMPCCDRSNLSKCRETCKRVLQTNTSYQNALDLLEYDGGCGPPVLQDYFWQCFFKEPVSVSVQVSNIDRIGIDSAKWHCCQRASTTQCQRLCSKTFTKFWLSSWDEFHTKCLSQVSEENLRNCIDEVDEPCELGCDGLSFCTNFNNRPTELFRSCTSQADDAARNDVALWQEQNQLSLPGLTLPLKNISKCSPNIWKTVACTLQIKPCSRHTHANQICRDVCLDILSQCVDWTTINSKYSSETICSTLSPDDPDVSCIHLQDFLYPSEYNYQRFADQVLSPCKGNPCKENEMCLVNKNCKPNQNCKSYNCIGGCKLGEASNYVVPDGTFVRIPIPNNPKGCLKICKCNNGKIEDCLPLPCISLTSCLLGNTQQLHGSTFELDCNPCSCFAGEVICSKKQCENSILSGRNIAYTTLPCNCPAHYVPVCGRDGHTYPSACLAKCAGLNDSDIELHPCEDPCRINRCPIGQKCIPNPQVCLSLMHKPCPQFICVNGSVNCKTFPKDPVCDLEDHQHDNVCYLAHNNSKLAYYGECLKNCNNFGLVCGINGKTYNSECAAYADFISIDYEGPCMTMGLISDIKSKQCPYVQCPKIVEDCLGITPPGACCPVCGGALRILYSRKQIDRALYALNDKNTSSLTLKSLLKSLERQIQVAQCALKGYLTVELDIFLLVQTTEKYPSNLQLEACIREAEKIANLINMQSPRIVSELSLSSLIFAKIVHTDENGCDKFQVNILLILVLIFVNILDHLF